MMKTKVFCVGFPKTGTSSIGLALKKLGYRVTGPNGVQDPNIESNALPMAYELATQYDAFQDDPWPMVYKEMDAKYPDSKFILTVRDPESWITSQLRHFGVKESPMRKWVYGSGCPQGNEDVYLKRFDDHNKDVLDYFKNRSGDFLVMDLFNGDGWEKLCPFLGIDPPARVPFPHANKAEFRKVYEVLRIGRVKKALKTVFRY